MNSQQSKLMGHNEVTPEREVHSNTSLPIREIFQINNLPYIYKNWKKNNKVHSSRRKEITKIKAEFNDIETKSTILRIRESRSWFFEKMKKIDKPLSSLIKK